MVSNRNSIKDGVGCENHRSLLDSKDLGRGPDNSSDGAKAGTFYSPAPVMVNLRKLNPTARKRGASYGSVEITGK